MSVATRPPAIRRWIPHRRFRPVTETCPSAAPGFTAGEPENCRRRPREFLAIMAELAVMLAVFDAYRIETRSFRVLVLLAAATLPLHYLAPYRWKKPLFVAISILGMALVHGLATSGGVLAIAAILLVLATSPALLADSSRTDLLGGDRPGLPPAAGDSGAEAVSAGIIPVVATMFMFRMIIYLYEQKHARCRESTVNTLSYFFLLPNYVFPHFPVVDYRTFQRGYFARGIHEIQRTGLSMISRGALHLFTYRVIDRLLMISPDAVHGPISLAGTWCAITCCISACRASSTWPAACSTCSASSSRRRTTATCWRSSFTDYWRRINIYWKDFMVRVVFNPIVFRLKRRSAAGGAGRRDGRGLPGHLALARLSIVLAAGRLGLRRARRLVLGHPGRAGAGQCPARGASRHAACPRALRGPRRGWRCGRSASPAPSRRSPCCGRSGRARASRPGWI